MPESEVNWVGNIISNQEHKQVLEAEKFKYNKNLNHIKIMMEEDKKREIRQAKSQTFWGLVTLVAIIWLGWHLYQHDKRVMTSLSDITSRIRL